MTQKNGIKECCNSDGFLMIFFSFLHINTTLYEESSRHTWFLRRRRRWWCCDISSPCPLLLFGQLLFCFLTFSFSVFPSPWFLVWLLESSSWGCCYCSSPGVAAAAGMEDCCWPEEAGRRRLAPVEAVVAEEAAGGVAGAVEAAVKEKLR